MPASLAPHPAGHFRFLAGIEPYSCGVVAAPGWTIEHVTLPQWQPWRDGFDWIDQFLKRQGLDRTALCALELRSPAPFSLEGFMAFNREYCSVLAEWGLLAGGVNPIARTNVAPVDRPPTTPGVHACSFLRRGPAAGPTFVVAGAGELREGILEAERIVRRGEAGEAALLDKAHYVLGVMEERLAGLGVGWPDVTTVNVYTAHTLFPALRTLLAERLGMAIRRGLTWHVSRPPVLEIEF